MRRTALSSSKSRVLRRGLSLIEVSISALIIGFVMLGALRCVGAVVRGRTVTSSDARGEQLAQQLMTEIINEDYIDPGSSPTFGREGGESATSRSNYDDVDDYHGWSSSPPEDRYNNDLPNLTGWRREVSVVWVDPALPSVALTQDKGLKRVTVTVSRNGAVVATLVGLKSRRSAHP